MRKGIHDFILSWIISFCKFLKRAFPFRAQQEATMTERSCNCRQEELRNLSQKVDQLMAMIQTMRTETDELKNMLTDALNKNNNNNKENDDEEVIHRRTSTPVGASPFQCGSHQQDNIPPQNPSPFQASGSSEFNAEEEEGFCDRPGRNSTTAAGADDSMPKVLESDNTDAKTIIASGFSARASEPAFSSAASTSLLTSPTNVFSFGTSSNKNNGSAVSSPAFSSPFPPMVANNLTSQNIFSGSSLATSSSIISATATSTSTSMTTSTPTIIASSNSSSSAPVTASSSPTTSLFKFGSTALPSTSLPVSSSGSEPVETKSGLDAGIGNIGSTSFGSSSASANNDQMSMEDSMAEDTVQATPPPVTPVFGQQPAPVQSNFVFGASTPTAASPFQFGGQQNIAPQNPSPFQASGSLEFNAGGSFSLGTGGGDKSGRKYVKVQRKPRKK